MSRISDFWYGRGGQIIRRAVVLLARGAGRLLVATMWQLRLSFARTTPRTRVSVIIVGLVLISAWTNRIAPSLSDTAQALAVLLLAMVGFRMILTAHVRRRW